MEKNYFENFDFEKFSKNKFSKNQKIKIPKFPNLKFSNLRFRISNLEILRFWFFDFSKKYFLENFQIKIFKYFFSTMKKYFSSKIFWRSGIYLYFRLCTLLAPAEVHSDLQTDNFNRSNGSRKVDFWWIFEDFQGFSIHFGLHPNSLPPKIRPKSIFKKFKLEEKIQNFFNFF